MSYDEFYRAYHRRVRGLAASKFGEADADDIAQEAMLRAYRHFLRLDPDRSPWPWLAVVTQNVGLNHVAAVRRVVPVESGVIEELSVASASVATDDVPATEAVAADLRRMLGRALHRLSDRDRSAIQLHELDGVPVADIAVRFGTTQNVIRQRLFRARRHLAHEVQALGGRPAATQPWFLPSPHGALARFGGWVADAARPWPLNLREDAVRAALAGLMLLAGGGTTVAAASGPAVTSGRAGVVSSRVERVAHTAGGLGGAVANLPAVTAGTLGDALARAKDLQFPGGGDQCSATGAMSATCPVTGSRPPPVAPGTVHLTDRVTSDDGTSLLADVLLPPSYQPGRRYPVVLAVGPDLDGAYRYPELWVNGGIFAGGFAYVQVGLRGRGGSDGCADFGGPGEQADVAASVRWAASQPWSAGRVGMWGLSYDGWAGVMALATAPPGLAAVVASAPSTGLYPSLYTDGVRYVNGLWPVTHSVDAARCAPPAVALADPDAGAPFWRQRDLVERAARSRVPVFWSHGFADPVAPAGAMARLFGRLRGPKQEWLGQYGHVVPEDPAIRNHWFTAAVGWLGRYVAGRPGAPADGGAVVQAADGGWRAEPAWPPRDASAARLPLRTGSYADQAGNHGDGPQHKGTYLAGCGIGSWTFSQPLPYDVHLAGIPRISVDVSVDTVVVALVYDVAPDNTVRVVTRGAGSARSGRAAFDLGPQDWRLARGHRIGVLLSGADDDWYVPVHTGAVVTVRRASLAVPFLRLVPAAAVAQGARRFDSYGFDVPAAVVADRMQSMPLPPPMR